MTQAELRAYMERMEALGVLTIMPGAFDQPFRGVQCEDCLQHMLEADGCYPSTLVINGEEFARIPYDNEILAGERETHRCHDCGAKLGQLHHFGCDLEVCPNCHGQAFICDCVEAVHVLPKEPRPQHAGDGLALTPLADLLAEEPYPEGYRYL